MDSQSDIVQLEHEPSGSKLKVTARWRGEVVHIDTLNPATESHRQRFIKALCAKLPAAEDRKQEVDAHVLQLADATKKQPSSPAAGSPDDLLSAMPADVRHQAESMLADRELVDLILADVAACGVVGECELALTVYVIGTSRLLTRPLAGILQGPSSTGKSYVQDKVARLFPDQAVLRATDITAQALYYLPKGSLRHTFVVAGERPRRQDDDRAEATRALREMLSAGELNKVVTVSPNRRQEAVKIHQPGPIAYVESTTRSNLFDEDANRCLLLATDESAEQTRAIMQDAARRAQGVAMKIASIVARHHALQRMLRRVEVVVPFADNLQSAIPDENPNARRALNHVLDMVRAVALLHQRQRKDGEIQHGDTIQATAADYVVARRLLGGPLGRALGGAVTPAVARFGARLTKRHSNVEFTSAQCAADDPVIRSRSKANEYLQTLADAGAVEVVHEHRGNKPAKWKVTGVIPDSASALLPTMDVIGVETDEPAIAYA